MTPIPGEIEIDDSTRIPSTELEFTTSRSSGPGGQNVDRRETRVTLRFDIEATDSLDEEEKDLLRKELATRINKNGILRVSAQKERSQTANKKLAVERFTELLRRALSPDEERVPTKVPRRAKEQRLREKKRRSEIKRLRKTPKWSD
ncbi:MAG: alternative ribosome rescue aminoacyl-tRNA hydrolase ArfB [Thermoanaerobaculia bacterium]|nr:alternative ribosome rescue aminoacyl-tRNA hydrolase ArfB [Thermoanaerobaculia bacterium]